MMGSWEAGVGSALTPWSGEWENEHFFCGLLVHVYVRARVRMSLKNKDNSFL